jgi:16S rRNA (guanine527-N7)-methyltransferase
MHSTQLLVSGAQQLHIHIDEQQIDLLCRYVQLLQKWNKAYNLTAIKNTHEIISRHILDSLSLASRLKGKKIIDIGSGAGLPGIPLAIIHPHKNFILVDSNAKKTRFITQATIELGLKNIQVVQQRVEDYQPSNAAGDEITTLVSRAFANSSKLLASCDHLFKQGRLIFMLGKQKQLEALPNSYNVVDILSVKIPQLEAQRHIAIVEKTAS